MNTRSRQARAEEIDEDVRTERVPLESPSKVLERGLADITHDRESVESIRKNEAVDSKLLPVGSASQTSRNTMRSKASRVRQAEYEVQKRLVALEKEHLRKKFELKYQEMEQEMELEMKLLKKRIAVDLSRADDEESIVECLPEQRNGNNSAAMVDRWLRSHSGVNNLSQGDREEDTALPEHVEPLKHSVSWEKERPISPIEEASVPRTRSHDQGMERLIGAFEKIATNRPPVRHAQDLPQFNGKVCDWLYFKVAYEDSTKLYKYSKAENMARLRTCLTGAAKETVAVLLSTACDPELIMNALDQCYGRPEIIIDKALEEIKRLPRPGYTAVEFNQFAIKVQNIAWLLKSVNDRSYTSNGALVREIVSKLNLHYQARWTDYGKANSNEKEPILITLSKYLLEEASLQLTFNYSRKIETATSLGTSKPRSKTNERVYSTQKKLRCLCCNGNHHATHCEEFLKMNLNQRWDRLRETKACFLCLEEYHRRSQCRKKRCGIDGCEKAHHRLLHWVVHKPQQQPLLVQPSTSNSEAEVVMSTSVTAKDECQAVLLKVCPVTVRGRNGKIVKTHALLDEGSTITIIAEKLAHELGVSGPSKPLKIQGVSSQTKDFESQHVKIDISRYDGGANYTLKARTMRDFDIGSQRISSDNLRYKHLVTTPTNDWRS
ncbi:uncharacterized protein LOC125058190 isoform X2 [Pieris napi]|uniref:uncharacterized protein LOC125058190 isoform X2 n=1 Tax=Pieris napi TaxID=78633 RepID=UPI001FB9B175|nr:uncharacterized protein LOC125058190 isoform X2 [Pieris napi]